MSMFEYGVVLAAIIIGCGFLFAAIRRERKWRNDPRLDQPAWPGAPHSARTELDWLRASGGMVGPDHPWRQMHTSRHGKVGGRTSLPPTSSGHPAASPAPPKS